METKENFLALPEVVTDFYGVGIPDLSAKLVKRTPTKAMYFRWDGVYEVFRVKIKEESDVFGKTYPRREAYPSSEDFGSIAWCFHDEKLANQMYNNLQ